jgi:hypothetical protein
MTSAATTAHIAVLGRQCKQGDIRNLKAFDEILHKNIILPEATRSGAGGKKIDDNLAVPFTVIDVIQKCSSR